MNTIKIKKNDQVKILIGKDRGKVGKVTQVFAAERKIVVEGVNKKFKNLRPRRENEKGQRIEFFGPIDVSKTILVCKKCGRNTRVSYKISEAKKYRVCKKCQEVID